MPRLPEHVREEYEITSIQECRDSIARARGHRQEQLTDHEEGGLVTRWVHDDRGKSGWMRHPIGASDDDAAEIIMRAGLLIDSYIISMCGRRATMSLCEIRKNNDTFAPCSYSALVKIDPDHDRTPERMRVIYSTALWNLADMAEQQSLKRTSVK